MVLFQFYLREKCLYFFRETILPSAQRHQMKNSVVANSGALAAVLLMWNVPLKWINIIGPISRLQEKKPWPQEL